MVSSLLIPGEKKYLNCFNKYRLWFCFFFLWRVHKSFSISWRKLLPERCLTSLNDYQTRIAVTLPNMANNNDVRPVVLTLQRFRLIFTLDNTANLKRVDRAQVVFNTSWRKCAARLMKQHCSCISAACYA